MTATDRITYAMVATAGLAISYLVSLGVFQ